VLQHTWKYAAAYDLADWDTRTKLPGYLTYAGKKQRYHHIVNSNGIANDCTNRLYNYGGRIITSQQTYIKTQLFYIDSIKELLPQATVNYRSLAVVYVHIPDLRRDLKLLKQIQRYIHENMPIVFQTLFSCDVKENFDTYKEYQAATRLGKIRTAMCQNLLPLSRLEAQLQADNIEQFYTREAPMSKNDRPLWHCQPKSCVSLRSLITLDMIEFRHFAASLNRDEMETCFEWCKSFLQAALDNSPIDELVAEFRDEKFPTFPPFNPEMEKRFRATVQDGSVDKVSVARSINLIERLEREIKVKGFKDDENDY
jgi:hypothetical protein